MLFKSKFVLKKQPGTKGDIFPTARKKHYILNTSSIVPRRSPLSLPASAAIVPKPLKRLRHCPFPITSRISNIRNMPHSEKLLIGHSRFSGGRDWRKCCPPYCDCEFPSTMKVTSYKGDLSELFMCRCGENDVEAPELQWQWYDHPESDVRIVGPTVIFHPAYSQGTSIVRGNKPLEVDMVHFWEIRILTVLAGTDVMVGIGTECVDLNQFPFHFASALGANASSWGFSYEGKIQHAAVRLPYGQKFSQGCIVGIYLDRSCGYLEFFLNRRSMGVAYKNIPLDPNIKLYPMVSSTTAKSAIRLINASSEVDCLQLRAFRALSKQTKALKELKQMPGFKILLKNYWFFAPPVRYSQRSQKSQLDLVDEAVLPSKSLVSSRKQKYQDDTEDINDLYGNAHKFASNRRLPEAEADHPFKEYFDEYFQYLF
uniref:B30.2/SPRY domain-containing protein n=1 Tax=Glossina palpalis gambiensis TaxID=67801 RepID=A0A1B0B1S1_9MUSC